MLSRLTFLGLLVFWLIMTYLLWRSEYVVSNQTGSAVPVALVWRKILNAPDNSTLEIVHNGRRMGNCQLSSSIGQDLANSKILSDDASAGGSFAPAPSGTIISLTGNVFLEELRGRLQVDGNLHLATNSDDWREFNLKITVKPASWELHSVASEQTIRLDSDDDEGRATRVIHFSDLQNPQVLLRDLDVPAPLGMLAMMNLPGGLQQTNPLPAMGLKWNAHNDWLMIGHTPIHVYRIDASLLEKYRMRVIVSEVGEIVRVELPDGWRLVNNELMSF